MQKYIVMLSLETVLRHFCILVLLLDNNNNNNNRISIPPSVVTSEAVAEH